MINISEKIEIEYVFESKAFFPLTSNLHLICFIAFRRKLQDYRGISDVVNLCLNYGMQHTKSYEHLPAFGSNLISHDYVEIHL